MSRIIALIYKAHRVGHAMRTITQLSQRDTTARTAAFDKSTCVLREGITWSIGLVKQRKGRLKALIFLRLRLATGNNSLNSSGGCTFCRNVCSCCTRHRSAVRIRQTIAIRYWRLAAEWDAAVVRAYLRAWTRVRAAAHTFTPKNVFTREPLHWRTCTGKNTMLCDAL